MWWRDAVLEWKHENLLQRAARADELASWMKNLFGMDVAPRAGVLKLEFKDKDIFAALGDAYLFFFTDPQIMGNCTAKISWPVTSKLTAGEQLSRMDRWEYDFIDGDVFDDFVYAYPSYAD